MDQLSYDSFDFDGAASTRSREGGRDSLLLSAMMRIAGAPPRLVRVRNLSRGGLMAEVNGDIASGDQVEVDVQGIGGVRGHVAWIAEGRAGIAFDHPIDARSLAGTADRTARR